MALFVHFFEVNADDEVPSVASGSSTDWLSTSPLASVATWVLSLARFFPFFFSADDLSLDTYTGSEFSVSFPSSTEVGLEELIAMLSVHV